MQDQGALETGQDPGPWPGFGTVDQPRCTADQAGGLKQPVLQGDEPLQPGVLRNARGIKPQPRQIAVADKTGFKLV